MDLCVLLACYAGWKYVLLTRVDRWLKLNLYPGLAVSYGLCHIHHGVRQLPFIEAR